MSCPGNTPLKSPASREDREAGAAVSGGGILGLSRRYGGAVPKLRNHPSWQVSHPEPHFTIKQKAGNPGERLSHGQKYVMLQPDQAGTGPAICKSLNT